VGQCMRVERWSVLRSNVWSSMGLPHSGHGFWPVGGSGSVSYGPTCAGPINGKSARLRRCHQAGFEFTVSTNN
jgi:hypothetical protein